MELREGAPPFARREGRITLRAFLFSMSFKEIALLEFSYSVAGTDQGGLQKGNANETTIAPWNQDTSASKKGCNPRGCKAPARQHTPCC